MATNNLTIALAGNPNSGKTTIFNNITGARQHVGNYSGVTVEKREGFRRFRGRNFQVVDLPGTYSLTARALDELVARNAILNDRPDILVNILDASNLERNLYLAVQLLELEQPMVVALNMADVAEKMGHKIDDQALTRRLGVPVVRTVGNRNRGTEDLLATVAGVAQERKQQPFTMDYGPEIEAKIKEVWSVLKGVAPEKYPLRWLAIKMLENDKEVIDLVAAFPGGERVRSVAENARKKLQGLFGEELEVVFAERRYYFVGEVYRDVVSVNNEISQTTSDKVDRVLTNRVLGLPIFLGIMWLLFNLVFTIGAYPQEWIENGAKWLGDFVSLYLTDGDLKSLVVDGIIGGVGMVVSFLPQILLLFLGIALLEDTGYMARAAFVMDRIMKSVGLHGKSFIPLLVGFGCNIPAIMGARTLENPRDRMVTILVAPLMSCSARLPVYTLLTAAFFSESYAGTVMFSIYILGIVLAVIMAWIFRKFLFPGETEPFAMEMPAYHIPTLRSILTHMWERGSLYLKKAGTIILAASILVWFFVSYPADVSYSKDFEQLKAASDAAYNANVNDGEADEHEAEIAKLDKEQAAEKLAGSYAGQFGHLIEPLIKPLGFDWKIGVSLFTGFSAKEIVVSTMGTLYSVGAAEDDTAELQESLTTDPALSPLVAYVLMVFSLIYTPCIATMAVVRRETNSWKWMSFSVLYSVALAWIVSFGVYRIGMFLGY
ncbi:MAG: der 3 [Firmicutes bacterium]|nr:der 3 [Bacillota bacterium]